MLVEIKDTPISYANAFASPVSRGDVIGQSVAQLAQYVRDVEIGYVKPTHRFWFSPNLRHQLNVTEDKKQVALAEKDRNVRSLDELVPAVVKAVGFDWKAVQQVALNLDTAR